MGLPPLVTKAPLRPSRSTNPYAVLSGCARPDGHQPAVRADAKLLIEFARRLDERRVFSAPYNNEIVESCLGSLASFKDITEEYLAKLDHAGARAAVGAILTCIRRFLDKWHGFSTRALGDRWEPPAFGRGDGERGRAFFEDLGQLRAEVLILIEFVQQFEPKVAAPSIIGTPT